MYHVSVVRSAGKSRLRAGPCSRAFISFHHQLVSSRFFFFFLFVIFFPIFLFFIFFLLVLGAPRASLNT